MISGDQSRQEMPAVDEVLLAFELDSLKVRGGAMETAFIDPATIWWIAGIIVCTVLATLALTGVRR